MKKLVQNKIFDAERALYNINDVQIINCKFEGPMDGESILKECRNYNVIDCSFSLRYPMWHGENFSLINSKMDEKTRAPIWYSKNGKIENSKINGIKCIRECENIVIKKCTINSSEFGWKSDNLKIYDTDIISEYFLFDSKNIEIKNLNMKGKYSFQYIENLNIKDSYLDTKDAFWHSKNILVENSYVKGEYLGWFSQNLTFVNCKIIGTQPLCYCKNLKLIDCTMENTDLSFEYSDVDGQIIGNIMSVKNPKSGIIEADSVGEIIMDKEEDTAIKCNGAVKIRQNIVV